MRLTGGSDARAGLAARVVTAGAWWAALTALWLALSGTVTLAEVLAGAGVGLAATLVTVSRHRTTRRPRVRWLRAPLRALATAPGDVVRLGLELARALRPGAGRPRGGTVWITLAPERDEARGAGRDVLAVTAGSLAPGSVVVEADGDRVLVHRLGAGGSPRTLADDLR
jgi:multisubunit Na+/H+ antiporter MnhE subunit